MRTKKCQIWCKISFYEQEKALEVSGSNGELSCGCLAFELCVSAAELRVALGGAVVQRSGFFVCFSILSAKIHDLHKPPKMNFWWTAKVLAAGLVLSCSWYCVAVLPLTFVVYNS